MLRRVMAQMSASPPRRFPPSWGRSNPVADGVSVAVVMRVLLPIRDGPRRTRRDRRNQPAPPPEPEPEPEPDAASSLSAAPSSSMWPPVSEKNTSSSDGCRTSMLSTSTPALSSARTTTVAKPVDESTPALSVRPSSLTDTGPDTNGAMAPTAPACGSDSVTSNRAPRLASFNCCGVPCAMTRPWSTTTMSWASSSASSRYCVVSSTVTPSPSSSRMASQTRSRDVGSRPSRRLVQEQHGRPGHQGAGQVQPAAHAARVALDHPVGGVGQLELRQQLLGPGPGVGPTEVRQLADQHQVLAPGQQWVQRRVLGGHADVASHLARVPQHVDARPPSPSPNRVAPAWSAPAQRSSCRRRSGPAVREWCRRGRQCRHPPAPGSPHSAWSALPPGSSDQ